MKKYLLLATIFSGVAVFSGCTASSWINAAGEAMKAKDSYDKKVMSDRLKRANDAVMRKK